MYDIVIRNAKTRKLKGLVDIGILDGKIKTIKEKIDEKGATEIDAKGKLVTESFVNAHLHLCKVCLLYTSPSPRDRQKSRMPSSA